MYMYSSHDIYETNIRRVCGILSIGLALLYIVLAPVLIFATLYVAAYILTPFGEELPLTAKNGICWPYKVLRYRYLIKD